MVSDLEVTGDNVIESFIIATSGICVYSMERVMLDVSLSTGLQSWF